MARDDVPAEVREQIKRLLTGLSETEEGKAILADMETARFILANDRDYTIVQTYISRFEKEVRAVEEK
jgi:phosphonate transport system substrate-binding protein